MQKKSKKYLVLYATRQLVEQTQEDLAPICGCSPSNYGSKERGDIPFTLEESFNILKTVNKLLTKKGMKEMTMEELFAR